MSLDRESSGADGGLLRIARDYLGWREAPAWRRCPACESQRECRLGRHGRALWCVIFSCLGLISESADAIERRLEAINRATFGEDAGEGATHAR